MKRNPRFTLWLSLAVVALAIAVPTAHAGEEMGVSVFVPDTFETSEMADGSTVEKWKAKGFAVSNDPSSPMYLITQTCEGKWLVAPDGSSRTGKGTCRSLDPDGDVLEFWWKGTQDGGTWGFQSGTGKWEGVEGGGSWQPIAEWEDGRYANSWKGRWTGGPETEPEDEEEPDAARLTDPIETGGD